MGGEVLGMGATTSRWGLNHPSPLAAYLPASSISERFSSLSVPTWVNSIYHIEAYGELNKSHFVSRSMGGTR